MIKQLYEFHPRNKRLQEIIKEKNKNKTGHKKIYAEKNAVNTFISLVAVHRGHISQNEEEKIIEEFIQAIFQVMLRHTCFEDSTIMKNTIHIVSKTNMKEELLDYIEFIVSVKNLFDSKNRLLYAEYGVEIEYTIGVDIGNVIHIKNEETAEYFWIGESFEKAYNLINKLYEENEVIFTNDFIYKFRQITSILPENIFAEVFDNESYRLKKGS